MSIPSIRGRARRALGVLTAGLVVTGALGSIPAATAVDGPSTTPAGLNPSQPLKAGRYVVLLKQDSATRYDGGTEGLSATQSKRGQFDADRGSVRAYQAHLRKQQRALADAVGATIEKQYTLASNGFTADLTGKQAVKLASDRRVLMVTEDTAFSLDTWNTPDFLGLRGEGGVWNRYGGPAEAGDGVVVGILDSGIWPESASFAGAKLKSNPSGPWGLAREGQTVTMRKADGGLFRGACEPGASFTVNECNTKLIGARYYPDAFLANVPAKHRAKTEYLSPRDGDGHGTHTASTAAGNNGVDVTVEGTRFGPISGTAPAAKIAAYKVCFEDDDPDTGGCYTSATLAAVDDAVADGVDVINYSISGAQDTVVDSVEHAFMGAAAAGVFVAASAGNSGPGASTVAHNSPWVTTVAAATHTAFENTAILGDGTNIKGASIASALPTGAKPLVVSGDVRLAAADPAQAALCYPGTLNPAKVAGKVVVCDRGVIDRVAKSAEVKRAGGVGMVLTNTDDRSLDSDFHSVPTVHVSHTAEPAVKSYVQSAGTTAVVSFEKGDTTGGAPTSVPQIAGFSSRGPALASDSDVLKPDIAAPGVSVLAAVSPPTNSGRSYDLYSGTSMSSPHVAGLAAFMLGVHPSWNPMTLKSAMMTTAFDLLDAAGAPSTDPFAQGAGHVDPRKFFDPGLVITSTADDWKRFYQGQGLNFDVEKMKATDLNTPSIAQGQVVSETTITRTFTALEAGEWEVDVDVPGFTATHDPTVKLAEGESQAVAFTFVADADVPKGKFATGFVTLTGPTTVRIPVALRPVSVKAPSTVRGSGTDGKVDVEVTAGFTGELPVQVSGLAKATTDTGDLAVGADKQLDFVVAAGTKAARYDLDAINDAADLDLYVYRLTPDGTALEALVGESATGSADESVTLTQPKPATYRVFIDGYAAASGQSTIGYRFDGFLIDGTADLGGFTATPNPVPVANRQSTTFSASWSGLGDHRYLGLLQYDGALAPTYVYVN